MNQGADSQSDIEHHVDEWIADKQAICGGWIEDAMNAAKNRLEHHAQYRSMKYCY